MARTPPTLAEFSDFTIDYTPIRMFRARTRMSQSDLARAVGVHWITISRIERNLIDPRNRLVLSIAKALGVPIYDLYTVTPPPDAGA